MGKKNDSNQNITRSKQLRRKVLKTMAAGSGAVIAGKSMPEQWSKPMVDSVLLPVHAQTSALTCSITGTVSGNYQNPNFDSGADGVLDFPGPTAFGPLAIPGDYPSQTDYIGTAATITPNISVTPGVTDSFNLTTTLSSTDAPGADLNQNVAPDPVNGTIAFNSITTVGHGGDLLLVTMTLTPDNQSFCGGPQVIDFTFGV